MLPLIILGLGLFVLISFFVGQGTNTLASLATISFYGGSMTLYFCPTIIAASRHHKNTTSIVVLNLFLGWTVVGWVGALVWAYSANNVWLPEVAAMPPTASRPITASPALALSMGQTKKCQFCAEEIKVEAIRCKHCKSDISNAHA